MCVQLFLVLLCSLALTSCNSYKLPPIKDGVVLRQDAALLYEQFPVSEVPTNVPDYDYQNSLGIRIIPKPNWPHSILDLHPYMVCSYKGGIQLWIMALSLKAQGKHWSGYYVVVNPAATQPQDATNHFVFGSTDKDGVQFLKQSQWETPKTH